MKKRRLLIVTVLVVASLLAGGCRRAAQETSYTYISAEDLNRQLKDKDFVMIDVHVPEQPHIIKTDAFIPYYDISNRIDEIPDDKDRKIVLYCLTNTMSIEAYVELKAHGYKDLYILDGGTTRWRELGYQFE